MSVTHRTESLLRVVLTAPPVRPDLAVDLLAAQLALSPAEAAARLARAPGVLAESLAPEAARRLCALLRLLGLAARCEARPGEAPERGFDLAIQPTLSATAAAIAARLAARTGRPAATIVALAEAPGGLTLSGLTWAAAAAWRRDAAVARAQVLVSHAETAVYDVLPWFRPADASSATRLSRHLHLLGLAPCPLTGAVAAGVDGAMADHLTTRFPGAGLLVVNRDFQRFDLVMTGVTGLSPRELTDFLITRTRAQPPQGLRLAVEAAQMPHSLDRNLTRAEALAFQSDYAQIGIEARLRLVSGPVDARR